MKETNIKLIFTVLLVTLCCSCSNTNIDLKTNEQKNFPTNESTTTYLSIDNPRGSNEYKVGAQSIIYIHCLSDKLCDLTTRVQDESIAKVEKIDSIHNYAYKITTLKEGQTSLHVSTKDKATAMEIKVSNNYPPFTYNEFATFAETAVYQQLPIQVKWQMFSTFFKSYLKSSPNYQTLEDDFYSITGSFRYEGKLYFYTVKAQYDMNKWAFREDNMTVEIR